MFFTPRRSFFSGGAYCAAAAVAALGLMVHDAPAAHAQVSLLANGDFETGTFAGWTVANVRDPADTNSTRNFYLDTPGTTTPPADGFFFNTAPNNLSGGGGSFYAVTTSNFPGETALLQSFTTPGGLLLNVTWTFDLFVNDQSGYSNTMSDGGSLDYTTGGLVQPRSNQYARVDLLTSSAGSFSTGGGDVLLQVSLNVPLNDDPNTSPNPYQRYRIDITPYVQANTTYQIRFGEVDNLSALNVGVDNVSVTALAAPEPAVASFFVWAPALLLIRRPLRRRS